MEESSPVELTGKNLKAKYRIGGRAKKGSHHTDRTGINRKKVSNPTSFAPKKIMLMRGQTGHCVMLTQEQFVYVLGYQLEVK